MSGLIALIKRRIMRQPHAVGKDADMLAQTPLVVEHVGAHVRALVEHAAERVADRAARGRSGPSGTSSRSHEVK